MSPIAFGERGQLRLLFPPGPSHQNGLFLLNTDFPIARVCLEELRTIGSTERALPASVTVAPVKSGQGLESGTYSFDLGSRPFQLTIAKAEELEEASFDESEEYDSAAPGGSGSAPLPLRFTVPIKESEVDFKIQNHIAAILDSDDYYYIAAQENDSLPDCTDRIIKVTTTLLTESSPFLRIIEEVYVFTEKYPFHIDQLEEEVPLT